MTSFRPQRPRVRYVVELRRPRPRLLHLARRRAADGYHLAVKTGDSIPVLPGHEAGVLNGQSRSQPTRDSFALKVSRE
jgi:hypothetical protein